MGARNNREAFTENRRQQRGRPREADLDQRILVATLELLARLGYDGTSVAAVAEVVGVTKPTIYLRWASKEELITTAVATLARDNPDNAIEDVWEALLLEITFFHQAISRKHGMGLIGTMLAQEAPRPQLLELFRQKVAGARRARIRSVLLRGQARGQIREDIDLDVVVNLLIGYFYSAYIGGGEIAEDWPATCLELIRPGIAVAP
ncbi:TetR/AcrR family transcriptional regulator [Streptomyces malaysiensis]|uniref:TetR/AcrR family transcriptional regulator n=1 Tax=Streptomyces malaysiensis TaxID=92644 RepID=UPI002B322DFE|nr:TetR/AcrR family transcriptional regulator [Streptomyces malaysiensis]